MGLWVKSVVSKKRCGLQRDCGDCGSPKKLDKVNFGEFQLHGSEGPSLWKSRQSVQELGDGVGWPTC